MLERVEQGIKKETGRFLIYGTEGVGKSTFGSKMPNPIFIDTEDGTGKLKVNRFKTDKLSTTYDVINALLTEKHDYKTLVIDSVDWLERQIWSGICDRYGAGSIEKVDGGYGKGYVYATEEWRRLAAVLKRLISERNMWILLIGHSNVEDFNEPNGLTFKRYSLNIHKKAASILYEWCDAIMLATRENSAAMGEDGGERILRTVGSSWCVAKNRYGFSEVLPLDWAPLANEIKTFFEGKNT